MTTGTEPHQTAEDHHQCMTRRVSRNKLYPVCESYHNTMALMQGTRCITVSYLLVYTILREMAAVG